MKRLSITLRVTLLYTLFMVLLAGLSLGFLFHAGAQTARQTKLNRMQSMVEEITLHLQIMLLHLQEQIHIPQLRHL